MLVDLMGRAAKKLTVLTVIALWLLVPHLAQAGEGLDVKEWLSRPGVKLVVVEFYSVYCKPCMKAVPKWKQLHEDYRSRGLRLVVVSADPGVCAQPDWNPDDVICDEYGLIQNAWKVDALPQAFMWDWQGRMRVARGTVEEAEQKIEKYFSDELRIGVLEPTDGRGGAHKHGESILTLVRGELSRLSKFEIVVSGKEADEIRKAQKESHSLAKAEKQRCQLGKEVSANSLLVPKLIQSGRGRQLVLELVSVEQGCVIGFSRSPVVGDDYQTAVVDVVGKLVRTLVHVENPRGVDRLAAARGEQKGAKVALSVAPADARWVLDGGRSGTLDSYKKVSVLQVSPGKHELELSREGYVPSVVQFYVERGDLRTIQETLVPKVVEVSTEGSAGLLNVTSAPEDGAAIFLDGKDTGQTTPATIADVPAGKHAVLVKRRFYKHAVKVLVVPQDDIARWEAEMEPNFGSLAVDSKPTGADVYVDGVRVGKTPYRKERQESKAYKIKLSFPLYHDLEATLFVEAGEQIEETFELPPAFGSLTVNAASGRKDLAGAEILLDLEPKDTAPATLSKIRSGRYQLTVKYPMHRDYSQEIEVVDGETTMVEAELDANYGTLEVVAKPREARIFVDGKSMGSDHIETNVGVGEHVINVEHRDKSYKPIERNVAVALRETVSLDVRLEQMTGELMVYSEPAGGNLILDGKPVGELPRKVRGLVVGPHTVRVEKEGFTPAVESVTVLEGELHKLKVALTKKASLEVSCGPGEGRIEVDGRMVGRKKVVVEALSSGTHTVRCSSAGYLSAVETLEVQLGQRYELNLRLDTPELLLARHHKKVRKHKAWGWVGIGGSLVLEVVAIWMAAEYSGASDTYDSKSDAFAKSFGSETEGLAADVEAARDDMQLYSTLGWVFAGTGVAALVFGIVEFATIPDKPRDLRVSPMFGPEGNGLSLQLAW